MALAPPELKKLVQICAMLGSSYDGERANAAALADRFVKDHGLTWTDVLHAEPPTAVVIQPTTPRYWKDCAEAALFEHPGALSEWETGFLQDILQRGRALSPKQEAKVRVIAQKTGVPEW
jgi:hypothetical protein